MWLDKVLKQDKSKQVKTDSSNNGKKEQKAVTGKLINVNREEVGAVISKLSGREVTEGDINGAFSAMHYSTFGDKIREEIFKEYIGYRYPKEIENLNYNLEEHLDEIRGFNFEPDRGTNVYEIETEIGLVRLPFYVDKLYAVYHEGKLIGAIRDGKFLIDNEFKY